MSEYNNIRLIPLSQGKFATVDAEDYENIKQWKWHFSTGYAKRTVWHEGKSRTVYMHRIIVSGSDNLEVDHINRNRLDNRKLNLRICTASQNRINTKRDAPKSSIYRGVTYVKKTKKWNAQIGLDNRVKHIGCFNTEIEAARAYDEIARSIHGEFACLNNV